MFRHVLQPKQMPTIIQKLHGGVGGHFFSNIMVKKILDADYWWPTIVSHTDTTMCGSLSF